MSNEIINSLLPRVLKLIINGMYLTAATGVPWVSVTFDVVVYTGRAWY